MKNYYMLLLFLSTSTLAQIPDNYYDNAANKSGDALKTALYNIIKEHKEFPYTSTSTDVWDILKNADRDPNNASNVIGIYSGFSMDGAAEYASGRGWSREHVWAKSRGDFGTSKGAGTDCHHIVAEDVSTNSARSNRNFDECNKPYTDNAGTYNGATMSFTSSTVNTWKPRTEVKGDVARMLFYMATRYEGEGSEPNLELTEILQSFNSKEPLHGKLSTLLKWHEEDPVSETEQNRNNIIYNYQSNRNPFIDHPEYVACIWGAGCNTDPTTTPNPTPNPNPNPTPNPNPNPTPTPTLAQIGISNTEQDYDGTPKEVTIITNPENLNTVVLYNGSEQQPTEAGTYTVQVTIDEANYTGSATATITISAITALVNRENKKLQAFPNPVSGILHIEAEDSSSIKLINNKGQIVFQGIGSKKIYTTKYLTGLYLLDIDGVKEWIIIK